MENKIQTSVTPELLTRGYGKHKDIGDALGRAIADDHHFTKATSSYSRGPFYSTDTAVSIRSEYNRADYDYRRPYESRKLNDKDIMLSCNNAYHSVGIIRNVVDLMSDFGSQGIRLIHPNKKIERFYQKWFELVRGKDRSERFLSQFYRLGNVVVERIETKVTTKQRNQMSVKASLDTFENPKVKPNVIPGKYIFHAPMALEILGGEAAEYLGRAGWAIKLPQTVTSKFQNNIGLSGIHTDKLLREIKRRVPEELLPKVLQMRLIPLDTEALYFAHYKKDDWETWGKSMLNSIMSDIIAYEKMKLADISALDGAISAVRIWKLGSLEYDMIPTQAGIARLRNILASNVGGGTIDLVWTPDLEFEETSSNAYQFLGPEKYTATISAIYDGVGIPTALTSINTSSTSSTNGFISLKVLQERLQYGRDKLVEFWNQEIKRVQLAMGFGRPAKVSFDHMILTDAQSELGLMIQLSDRNLISDESLLEKFRQHPEIEKVRVRKEQANRDKEIDPPKASPYHNPQEEHELRKIFAQRGVVVPSQVGLELDEKKEGEESFMDMQGKQQLEQQKFKPTGRVSDGRPKGAGDTQKRKQRTFTPQTSAALAQLIVWSNEAYKSIASSTHSYMLELFNKKNLRSLTNEEKESVEHMNFQLLCETQPFSVIEKDMVVSRANVALASDDISADYQIVSDVFNDLIDDFINEHQRQPTIDERRTLQCYAYSISMLSE